jgi:hypothetical protein
MTTLSLPEDRPAQPEELRAFCWSAHVLVHEPVSQGVRGALIAHLEQTLGGRPNRIMACTYLFNPADAILQLRTSATMSGAMWIAIGKILDLRRDPVDGRYWIHPAWATERLWVMNAATNHAETHKLHFPFKMGPVTADNGRIASSSWLWEAEPSEVSKIAQETASQRRQKSFSFS